MTTRILSIALISVSLAGLTGCSSNSDFKKLKGIEYKIIKDAPGKTAQIGDIIEVHILAKADTMVLADSRAQQQGKPVGLRVEEVKNSGQFQAVFTKLSAGDSAVVRISCDTLLKANPPQPGQQLPPWLKKGKMITVSLSVAAIKSMDEYKKEMEAKQAEMQKEMEQKAAVQMPIDDKILQEYLAKNNIKATKTASGLYYTISKEGTGATAKEGQMVTMNYIGKTLEGKQFDANVDENFKKLKDREPFTFPLGAHQVIKGWDEGVALLKKGSKATFYIPSPLAYGSQSPSPDIAPNSILVFNVEVLDIKDGTQGNQAPPAPAQ